MNYNIIENENQINSNDILSIRQIAEELWSLLDSIDTLSDICKPTIDNPKAAMAFYNNALRYSEQRSKFMRSDGYKIYTHEEYDLLPKTEAVMLKKDI